MSQFWDKVDTIEAQLDMIVDSGTDDELFIASYFHGHFSLAVSQVPDDVDDKMVFLRQTLIANLNDAFVNRELEDIDQQKIWTLLERLF
ncbi:MAG: YfcL family protein [Glaciecola sp.]|jgi:hypothetical protein|uniref:YfcL family protein n=1 Tax=Glaciecola sp. HTCC2999 TaxID=455436 RepID=UPI0000E0E875|nr:YfcL family protein [Glaciecola sp. HTCC2999]MCH1414772.1 YfcL family protein [Glaciecola sp.]